MKKILRRYSNSVRGIAFAIKNDPSYRTQFYGFGAVVMLLFAIFTPVEPWEALFIILAWFLILITELQNSALEAALDRIHPERHDEIGRSKDMAAGAVLTAGLFLVVVIAALVIGRV